MKLLGRCVDEDMILGVQELACITTNEPSASDLNFVSVVHTLATIESAKALQSIAETLSTIADYLYNQELPEVKP